MTVDTVRERLPAARIGLTAPKSVSASAYHQFGLAAIERIENAIQCRPETDGTILFDRNKPTGNTVTVTLSP